MKTLKFSLLVAIFAMVFTSCKKDVPFVDEDTPEEVVLKAESERLDSLLVGGVWKLDAVFTDEKGTNAVTFEDGCYLNTLYTFSAKSSVKDSFKWSKEFDCQNVENPKLDYLGLWTLDLYTRTGESKPWLGINFHIPVFELDPNQPKEIVSYDVTKGYERFTIKANDINSDYHGNYFVFRKQ